MNVLIYRYCNVISDTWKGCQQYYYRCISRKAKLASALMSPSKVSIICISSHVTTPSKCKAIPSMKLVSALMTLFYLDLASIPLLLHHPN